MEHNHEINTFSTKSKQNKSKKRKNLKPGKTIKKTKTSSNQSQNNKKSSAMETQHRKGLEHFSEENRLKNLALAASMQQQLPESPSFLSNSNGRLNPPVATHNPRAESHTSSFSHSTFFGSQHNSSIPNLTQEYEQALSQALSNVYRDRTKYNTNALRGRFRLDFLHYLTQEYDQALSNVDRARTEYNANALGGCRNFLDYSHYLKQEYDQAVSNVDRARTEYNTLVVSRDFWKKRVEIFTEIYNKRYVLSDVAYLEYLERLSLFDQQVSDTLTSSQKSFDDVNQRTEKAAAVYQRTLKIASDLENKIMISNQEPTVTTREEGNTNDMTTSLIARFHSYPLFSTVNDPSNSTSSEPHSNTPDPQSSLLPSYSRPINVSSK